MNDIHAKSAGKIPIKWWPTFSFIFEKKQHTAAKSPFLFKIQFYHSTHFGGFFFRGDEKNRENGEGIRYRRKKSEFLNKK